VAVLVAIGVNAEGFREVIGCEEGYVESEGSWKAFLLGLRERGLSGVRMCIASLRSGPPRHRYLSRYRHEN
jgi:transposase-like protein